ncbi:hypothetical protein ASE61_00615 [Bosea sp. Root670]|uniref:hypothetical protein n=1 Tax=Bosea sp. Root670 TaxID=1736583 RepID=UPI000714C625|nr:hypothetical protein [Bosea sp. Root670]KRE08153.1 hypothetical protein ASE61_00615 [Bosea sp. Root670]
MKRNPRRAYNKDGSEIQPATVASHMALGRRRIEIYCNECHHHANGIDASGLPPETPIPDICLRYRCSVCGSKNLMSRGDTHEHYELIEAARKGTI